MAKKDNNYPQETSLGRAHELFGICKGKSSAPGDKAWKNIKEQTNPV